MRIYNDVPKNLPEVENESCVNKKQESFVIRQDCSNRNPKFIWIYRNVFSVVVVFVIYMEWIISNIFAYNVGNEFFTLYLSITLNYKINYNTYGSEHNKFLI